MFSLDNAVCYDCESFPNFFSLAMEMLNSDVSSVWEISEFRDDRAQLFTWFEYLNQTRSPMIGFFSNKYDYPLVHWLFNNPQATVGQIYERSRQLATLFDGWGGTVWARDQFAPQIDLFSIHHFDNKAKTTSLKALQVNMRSPSVVDAPVEFGKALSHNEIGGLVIPYNQHDVKETKRFALYSMGQIKFRIGLIDKFGIEVLNYNDVKIGAKMFEQRLGADLCYSRDANGRKQKRQTPRGRVALADIIFPYIRFNHPEFQRVHAFMRDQILTPADITDPDALVQTKGVFKGLTANVGGIEFVFGTGGVHASVEKQRFIADDTWLIRDIDVKALYPSIAIQNGLYPEHLGPTFVEVYKGISAERDLHAKGTVENGMLKLANNGPWGQSNNKHSIFLDPKYAMTVPINGQLMICMLAECLITVPTLTLIQANTDGITYRIHRDYLDQAKALEKQWQAYTCLTLEDAAYKAMWIRDVNNYVAQDTKGKLKQKGAYWYPESGEKYAESISNASPPCWYKDFNPIAVPRATIAAMVYGIDPETWLRSHSDPFDFMCRIKADGQARLYLGGQPIQKTTRYYVATNGLPMTIVRPPAGPEGAYKRKNGITEPQWRAAMEANNWQWTESVCTGKPNKPDTWGKYEERTVGVEAGWKIAECNDARSFNFANLDYRFYLNEVTKLIVV